MKYLLMLLLFTSCAGTTSPGQGRKVGRIVKLERVGLLYKTWEGELIRGGITDGSGSMGTSFHFTIEDGKNLELAENALQDQCEVTMTYRTEFISSLSRSEDITPHFVVDISRNHE